MHLNREKQNDEVAYFKTTLSKCTENESSIAKTKNAFYSCMKKEKRPVLQTSAFSDLAFSDKATSITNIFFGPNRSPPNPNRSPPKEKETVHADKFLEYLETSQAKLSLSTLKLIVNENEPISEMLGTNL